MNTHPPVNEISHVIILDKSDFDAMLLNGPKAIDAMNETNAAINIAYFIEKRTPPVNIAK